MKHGLTLLLGILLLENVSVARASDVALDPTLVPLTGEGCGVYGISFGVPFLAGEISDKTAFAMTDAGGREVPVQTWTMATWPDGSPKWLGVAAVLPDTALSAWQLSYGNAQAGRRAGKASALGKAFNRQSQPMPAAGTCQIRTDETSDRLRIDNGLFVCEFEKPTADCPVETFLAGIYADGKLLAADGRLLLETEHRDESPSLSGSSHSRIVRYADCPARIRSVVLEQAGPVRAVVRVEATHASETELTLPTVMRFYIYAGSPAVKLVHSFVFDGQAETDHISALGLQLAVPLREELHNRHVAFAGDSGIWHEPVKPLTGRRVLREAVSMDQRAQDYPLKYGGPESSPSVYHRQLAFQRIAPRDSFDRSSRQLMDDWASWNDFQLSQPTPDGFTLGKRTQSKSPWLIPEGGNRSLGLALVGDVSGGLAVSVKDFWQSYPTMLEICNACADTACLKLWLWSPEAPAMDLRHYDTVPHGLNAAYEDIQEGLSTPTGIARTHELTLFPLASLSAETPLLEMARAGSRPAWLTPTPEWLHSRHAFGSQWSLRRNDSRNDTVRWVESQLDQAVDFYLRAVEDNRWYGFWNYGDVMHAYDAERHCWLYDVGGFAWDNTELAPEMWLWYTYLRSGRADVYRLAEAMSRHTAEVDVYHLGPLKGLGSRHNVSHWGCGAKEARIAQAAFRRFLYYLSTDERMGDLIGESVDADFTCVEMDPLRIAKPRSRFPSSAPGRLRWGPDWISFAGNWFTEWERSGNSRYLDKMYTGMDCLAAMPAGLFTTDGPCGYFPETGKLIYEGPEGANSHTLHLATIMGGFELMAEMWESVQHPAFRKAWLDYCTYYTMPEDDPLRTEATRDWGPIYTFNTPRLTAWAAREYARPESPFFDRPLADNLRTRAWREFLRGRLQAVYVPEDESPLRDLFHADHLSGPEVMHDRWEIPTVSTNGTSQWSLNAIFLLELLDF